MTTKTINPRSTNNAEAPLVVSGGFGYDHERTADTIEYVRSLGKVALDPLPDRDPADRPDRYTIKFGSGMEMTTPRQLAYLLAPHPEVTHISSQRQHERAKELINHIEEQEVGPVNGIFQSADAQNGLIAAYERPDLFNNIVLAFPAGLIKKKARIEYMPRMIKGAFQYRRDKHTPVPSDDYELPMRSESLRERKRKQRFGKSGGAAVAGSVAVSYQNDLLTEIRQKVDAPGIAFVLGLKDAMMQPERIIESLNSPDDVDCIYITNTKHGINGNKRVMNNILQLFPWMEEIKKRRKAGQNVGPLADRVMFADNVGDEDRQRIVELVSRLDEK